MHFLASWKLAIHNCSGEKPRTWIGPPRWESGQTTPPAGHRQSGQVEHPWHDSEASSPPSGRFGLPDRWCHECYTSSAAVVVALNTRMHPHAFNVLVPWNLRTLFGLTRSSLFRGIAKLARIENQLESPSNIPQISDGLQVINQKNGWLIGSTSQPSLLWFLSFHQWLFCWEEPQIRRCFFVSHERNTLLLSIVLLV